MKKYDVCIYGYGEWPKKFINNLEKKFRVKYIISDRKSSDNRVIKKLNRKNFKNIDIFFLAKDFENNYIFFMKYKSVIKNVVFEKPLTNKLFKIKRIIKACNNFKIKCLVSYPFLYSKIYEYISNKSKNLDLEYLSLTNVGNGPVRKYIDPINDYIPLLIVIFSKLLNIKLNQNLKINDLKSKLQIQRKLLNLDIEFLLNKKKVSFLVGNNAKIRNFVIKIIFVNGDYFNFNIIKKSYLNNGKKVIIDDKQDNISAMLNLIINKKYNQKYFINNIKNEILFFELKKIILPRRFSSF